MAVLGIGRGGMKDKASRRKNARRRERGAYLGDGMKNAGRREGDIT